MTSKEKFKAYASAYVILMKDGQVLLSRRANTGYRDGMYSLVAGHFEGGETAKQCIMREAAEEAGISLNPDDLEVAYCLHRLSLDREYFDVFLTAEKWQGEIVNMEPEKCGGLEWFPLNDLPTEVIPEVRQAIEHIGQGIHFGEIGW
ncbi:NUDIX domain-containing protein [Candidatus Falkowbacteria bacterium]|nr:NUDIX domain-containing protein [Candidatus Falkowbacteria bacterium]